MTLEASSNNVPSIKIVTELLQEEQKLKEKGVGGVGKTLSTAKGNSEKRQGTCHYCKEPEHYKRECKELAQAQLKRKPKSGGHSANKAAEQHVPKRLLWLSIHPLHRRRIELWTMEPPGIFATAGRTESPAVGDDNTVDVKGVGTVWRCLCHVPELAYNLQSVLIGTETVKFDKTLCENILSDGCLCYEGWRSIPL